MQTVLIKNKQYATHKDVFVHAASIAEVFCRQVIKGIDSDPSTRKTQSFHVTSFCPTQCQNTSFRQHIQRQWIYAL